MRGPRAPAKGRLWLQTESLQAPSSSIRTTIMIAHRLAVCLRRVRDAGDLVTLEEHIGYARDSLDEGLRDIKDIEADLRAIEADLEPHVSAQRSSFGLSLNYVVARHQSRLRALRARVQTKARELDDVSKVIQGAERDRDALTAAVHQAVLIVACHVSRGR